MASIKNLKKDINHTLGDLIEECFVWELVNPEADTTNSQAIIDEAVETFDQLLNKVNTKNVQDRKAHFKGISNELEVKARALVERVNAL